MDMVMGICFWSHENRKKSQVLTGMMLFDVQRFIRLLRRLKLDAELIKMKRVSESVSGS